MDDGATGAMSLGEDTALSPLAARIVLDLFSMADRARNKTQSRTISTLMLKGGRPAQWLQETLLLDLERIGLVSVAARGACALTPVGREVARWFEREAPKAFPMTVSGLVDASMARLMNAGPDALEDPARLRVSAARLLAPEEIPTRAPISTMANSLREPRDVRPEMNTHNTINDGFEAQSQSLVRSFEHACAVCSLHLQNAAALPPGELRIEVLASALSAAHAARRDLRDRTTLFKSVRGAGVVVPEHASFEAALDELKAILDDLSRSSET